MKNHCAGSPCIAPMPLPTSSSPERSARKNCGAPSNVSASKAAAAPEPEKKPESAADKATEERHRRFLLGKKASRDIVTDTGVVIVKAGDDITEEVLQKAKLANKFIELSMNIH